MADEKTQVAVVGAGPGGYAAAFLAADLGLKVTLIDPAENPGGVCLYTGCIPTKALLHVAKTILDARDAPDWGVEFPDPKINIEKMRAWKESVVKKLTEGLGQLTRQRKISYVKGKARLLTPRSLELEETDGRKGRLNAEHIVLATGSRPGAIGGLSFDSQRVMDSTDALELSEIPETMLVVGAGYIGLELGSVYAALGTKVTMVEMMPGILPGADRDIVAVFERRAGQLFDSIILNTTVELEEQKQGIRAVFKRKDAENSVAVYDRVLLAVGRKPNTDELGLENTRVQVDEKGFLKVDEQRKTDEPSIYAVGDITGNPLLAHKATHEGRVAAEAIAGRKSAFDPRAIPAVEYTDPEIAWCGLTETQAEEEGREVQVAKFPWGASGRAATLGRSDGLTKLIIEPASERILGVAIVGTGAGELISEGALAVEMAALASDLALTIHPHPTLSETLKEAAESFYGEATSIYRPKKRRS